MITGRTGEGQDNTRRRSRGRYRTASGQGLEEVSRRSGGDLGGDSRGGLEEVEGGQEEIHEEVWKRSTRRSGKGLQEI